MLKKMIFFVFLFCFCAQLSLADDCVAAIDLLGESIDKCREVYLEEKDKIVKNAEMTSSLHNQLMANNNTVQACYREVGKQIFEQFYSGYEDKMLKDLDDFVDNIYTYYLNVYANNKFCKSDCGLMPYLQAKQSVTYDLQNYLIVVLDNLYKLAKD